MFNTILMCTASLTSLRYWFLSGTPQRSLCALHVQVAHGGRAAQHQLRSMVVGRQDLRAHNQTRKQIAPQLWFIF